MTAKTSASEEEYVVTRPFFGVGDALGIALTNVLQIEARPAHHPNLSKQEKETWAEVYRLGKEAATKAEGFGIDSSPIFRLLEVGDWRPSEIYDPVERFLTRLTAAIWAAGPAQVANRGQRSENTSVPSAPLTPLQQQVFDIIKSQPEGKGIQGKEICREMKRQHEHELDQSTLTRHIIPKLKPYGVANRQRVGYYVEST